MLTLAEWLSKIVMIAILFLSVAYAGNNLPVAVTKPIPISDIKGFENYSPALKKLINEAYLLTQKNLTYLYGSADPARGGMDCSGTIYYLLTHTQASHEIIPRQSDEIYSWVEKQGKLYHVKSQDFSSSEFATLKPGDLLFWSGTYEIKRTSNITHVMLYLGKDRNDKPIMFGASDGRTYKGMKMWGVSVFDFNLPSKGSRSRFEGYGCIPGLTCK